MRCKGRGGRPGFGGASAGEVGDYRPGAQPIVQGRSERAVGPALPGRRQAHGVIALTCRGDGRRVPEAAAEE
jgi:hypothetical protein